MRRIPFLRPDLVRKERFLHYLEQIEDSRIYSNYGPLNSLFENRVVSEYFRGTGAVTTVCNATTGLMLAVSQSKRPTGRYALMPSFTFPATPLAAMWCGLEPYFLDIREDTWCVEEEEVDKALNQLGNEVAVVVPYATFGTAVDLAYYAKLQASGVPVVVDAAASFGTIVSNEHFGTKFQGIIVFSFHATKPFGIGEGGLIYSGNIDSIKGIRCAANFGFRENRESSCQGLNAKLSEYGAAIGLATLDVFEEKIAAREKVANWYRQFLNQAGFLRAGWALQRTHGRVPVQFMSVLCPQGHASVEFVTKLTRKGIEARTYFLPPCHQQRQFTRFPTGKLTSTENIGKRVINLPFWEDMTFEVIKSVIDSLHH